MEASRLGVDPERPDNVSEEHACLHPAPTALDATRLYEIRPSETVRSKRKEEFKRKNIVHGNLIGERRTNSSSSSN
jgi:hypothetical protein